MGKLSGVLTVKLLTMFTVRSKNTPPHNRTTYLLKGNLMDARTMAAKIFTGVLFITGGVVLAKIGSKPLAEVLIDLTYKLQK